MRKKVRGDGVSCKKGKRTVQPPATRAQQTSQRGRAGGAAAQVEGASEAQRLEDLEEISWNKGKLVEAL